MPTVPGGDDGAGIAKRSDPLTTSNTSDEAGGRTQSASLAFVEYDTMGVIRGWPGMRAGWNWSGWFNWPVARSQRKARPSKPDVKKSLPSSANARL